MNNYKILIHYGEIALKGKNRAFFENKLIQNIKVKLHEYKPEINHKFGQIILETNNLEKNQKNIIKELSEIFGITNYSIIEEIDTDFKKIETKSLEIINNKKFKTFKVAANRIDKNFELTSPELNAKIGESILNQYSRGDAGVSSSSNHDIKVKLKNPDLILHIDIDTKKSFIYTNQEKFQGLGGLPVGVSGKLVSMISSGIDSPVSSYLMMKRGAEIIYTHFHSHPFTSNASIENVEEIIKKLEKFQPKSKFYSIPIGEIQKQISIQAPSNLRIILYRRIMIKIASQICQKEGALGLVTGESLGQVASQTLENMHTTSEAATSETFNFPIYRPLISYDKQEIVDLAKDIGTYDISIRPADDCCTYLAPPQVATKTKLGEILKIEQELNIDKKLPELIKPTNK